MGPATPWRFHVPEHVHCKRFDSELIVLDLVGGKYFALDPVASDIWDWLTAGQTQDQIVAGLLATYDTDEPTARADVQRLVGELVGAGLLERPPVP